MADISSYLAAIMAAVYGEDVRGSIHDAIEIINDVSEVVLNTGTAVTGPTSSSTGFYRDSFYINTNTMELWKCIGTDSWQSQGVLKGADGADGNGIVSITKTATVGLVDTYTITYDDGTTSTYDVTNGQNGSKWYKGTAISGTGTSITGFPGVINDFYLNSTDGYVYTCTKTGGSLPPDAAEWDYVMTLTGGGGSSVTVIDNLTSTSSTDALSANQGRVLKGLVDSKADASSVPSDLDDLSDVTITSPASNQVLKYNGSAWVNGTGGGHTMIPNNTYEASLVSKSTDNTDDDVASGYAISNWSNNDVELLTVLASKDTDTIGTWTDTWETDGVRTGWLWSASLYQVLKDGNNNTVLNKEIEPIFDCGESEVVSLYAYRIDDDVTYDGNHGGAVAFKFNGKIQSANGVKVGLKIIHQKTKVNSFTVLT